MATTRDGQQRPGYRPCGRTFRTAAAMKLSVPLSKVFGGGFIALGLLVTAGVLFYVREQAGDALLRHSLEVEVALSDVLSLVQDAEVGQRGYLLTGDLSFLEPYRSATAQLSRLGQLVSDNPTQVDLFSAAAALTRSKQAELAQTLDVRQAAGIEAALRLVQNRTGKQLMDDLRQTIGRMDAEEGRLVAERQSHVRSVGLLTAAATSVSVVLMGVLALSAMREVRRRASLARFLPAEVAPLLADGDQALRRGANRTAAVAFVDIRGSTALAERLDPAVLSQVLSRFRRHVSEAAQRHAGLIDKFIGDGALVVFGAVIDSEGAAAHALSFARDLIERIGDEPADQDHGPLRIGIGIHYGEVFCGIIGDDDRLEFTVLGDTVNVAARIEDANKRFGTPLLVSEEVLTAAREPLQGWSKASDDVLPGRQTRTVVYAENPR